MKKLIIHLVCNVMALVPNVKQHITVCFDKCTPVRVSARKYFFKDILTSQSQWKAIMMSTYFKKEYDEYYL